MFYHIKDKVSRRIIACLLGVLLSVGLYSSTAFAENADSGYIGNSELIWELSNGILTIGGSGEAPIFASPEEQPWADVRDEITSIVYENMDAISMPNMQYWFTDCTNLEKTEIPYTASYLGASTFKDCPNLRQIFLYYNNTDTFSFGTDSFFVNELTNTTIYYDTSATRVRECLEAYNWEESNRSVSYRDVYIPVVYADYCSCGWKVDIDEVDVTGLVSGRENGVRLICPECGERQVCPETGYTLYLLLDVSDSIYHQYEIYCQGCNLDHQYRKIEHSFDDAEFDRLTEPDNIHLEGCYHTSLCSVCGYDVYEECIEEYVYVDSNTCRLQCAVCLFSPGSFRHYDTNCDGKCDSCGGSNSYTVIWDASTNGGTIDGSNSTTTTVEWGTKATKPSPTPTKTGYTFKNWYTTSTGSTLFSSKTITADTTFYAQFTINSYTLTWNVDGSTSTTSQDCNTSLTLPTSPTKTGYTFKGWYTAASGGTKVTSSTKVTADKTYYAQWTINTSTLKVDPNGGTWGGSTSATSKTQNYNTTLTVANPTITNYTATFNGNGGTAGSSSIKTTKAFSSWTKSSTFTAGTLSGTTFTFGATKGGTGTLTASWTGNYTITLPTASRTGYTFKGWYTAASSGTKVGDAGDTVTLSSNVTYYAQWTIHTSTLSINPNGGTWGGSTSTTTKTQNYNTTLTVANPTITNYTATFNGNGGTAGSSSIKTTKAFSAWTKSSTFTAGTLSGTTFTFGATKGGTGTLTASWTGNYDITLPTASRTGYTFKGWYTAASGGTKVGNAGDAVTLSSNVTYYAQWTANTYSIEFIVDGSSVGTYVQTYDQERNFPTVPTKTGYTFYRWDTKETGGGNYYVSTGKWTFTKVTKLYAQWNIHTSTLIVDPNGGTWGGSTSATSKTQDYNTTLSIPIPTRTGYTFSKWTRTNTYGTMSTLTAAATYTFGATDGVTDTIKASWTINSSTLTINPNGGTWGGSTSATSKKQNYNTTLTIADPTITNYTATFDSCGGNSVSAIKTNKKFSSWSKSSTFTAGSLSGTTFTFGSTKNGTGTLTAQWSGSYTITLPAAPTKTGYTFKGWYTAASGGTKVGGAGDSVTLTDNTPFYAQWTANTYTATWIVDDATYTTSTHTYKEPFVYATAPAKTGYTFDGWYSATNTSLKLTAVNYDAAGDTSYVAKYTANTYTLTLLVDGEVYATKTQTYDQPRVFPDDPVKPGYTFTGWYSADNDSGAKWNTEMDWDKTTNRTVEARFTPNTYTITWEVDEAAFATSSQVFDQTVTLPTAQPSKDKHHFDGWWTADGYPVTAETIYQTAGNVTYYARWIQVFSVTVPVTMPVVMGEDGEVYAPKLTISNTSTGDVRISSVTLKSLNGWTIVPYSTNMANEKVNAKLVGLSLNGLQTSVTAASESFTTDWVIGEDETLLLSYDAVISATSQAYVDERILEVVFIVEWAS